MTEATEATTLIFDAPEHPGLGTWGYASEWGVLFALSPESERVAAGRGASEWLTDEATGERLLIAATGLATLGAAHQWVAG